MADRFAKTPAFGRAKTPAFGRVKTPAFGRTPTPLLYLPGESKPREIKVRQDPPLRKVPEELSPAFDIPELEKKRLPPLGSIGSCEVANNGDKEAVTLPGRSRPRDRVAKSAKKEKKRTGQKQSRAVRESTPDIDQLVRKLCGGTDLPPFAPFAATQPVLPSVVKNTENQASLQGEQCAVKMDKAGKKKDKRKNANGEGEKSSKKREKKTKKAKMATQTPLPPAVSPEFSQMMKNIQDIYDRRVGSSAAKTHSTDVFMQDPLMAFQNCVQASECTAKGNIDSRKPLREMSTNSRQPLRGSSPFVGQPVQISTPIVRQPFQILPNSRPSPIARQPKLQRTTPYPEINRKSSPEFVDLNQEVTFSFDINEELEEDESLAYTQSIPFLAPASQVHVARKPLVSEPTRLGLLPKPPAFPKPPSARGGAQIGFRRRRYQAGVQKQQHF